VEEKSSERESAMPRQKSPPEKELYRKRRRSPAGTRVDAMEGAMFDFIINRKNSGRKNSVPRPSLYCVWFRAHEGENAPLIRVWIDPSMSIFESQGKVHEADLEVARDEAQAALAHEDNS
jgi:hypothetical protein